jgi:hypothetical protein
MYDDPPSTYFGWVECWTADETTQQDFAANRVPTTAWKLSASGIEDCSPGFRQ